MLPSSRKLCSRCGVAKDDCRRPDCTSRSTILDELETRAFGAPKRVLFNLEMTPEQVERRVLLAQKRMIRTAAWPIIFFSGGYWRVRACPVQFRHQRELERQVRKKAHDFVAKLNDLDPTKGFGLDAWLLISGKDSPDRQDLPDEPLGGYPTVIDHLGV